MASKGFALLAAMVCVALALFVTACSPASYHGVVRVSPQGSAVIFSSTIPVSTSGSMIDTYRSKSYDPISTINDQQSTVSLPLKYLVSPDSESLDSAAPVLGRECDLYH
jgi:hypothetical protein